MAQSKPKFAAMEAASKAGRRQKSNGHEADTVARSKAIRPHGRVAVAAANDGRAAAALDGKPVAVAGAIARRAVRNGRGDMVMVGTRKDGPAAKGGTDPRRDGKVNTKSIASAPDRRTNGTAVSSIAVSSRSGGDKVKGIDTIKSAAKSGEAGSSGSMLPTGYRPSESEPFMSERQRLYFRHKLIAWKEEIVRQNRETLQGLHEESAQHADVADRATFETDRALELRARDRQRKLIAKIDAALARLEEGSYGYCEETGEPISLKRLDARPIATLSIEAQERHERRERVFREE